MLCPHCATELPDDANYCLHCGRAQGDGQAAPWAACEILCARQEGVLSTCRFWARAVGPQGVFCAGSSPAWVAEFPDAEDPQAWTAHRVLVQQLLAAGWRYAGRGWRWYNDRFRQENRAEDKTG